MLLAVCGVLAFGAAGMEQLKPSRRIEGQSSLAKHRTQSFLEAPYALHDARCFSNQTLLGTALGYGSVNRVVYEICERNCHGEAIVCVRALEQFCACLPGYLRDRKRCVLPVDCSDKPVVVKKRPIPTASAPKKSANAVIYVIIFPVVLLMLYGHA
ncbi:hypothetical protein AAVH_09768 [Aphelenchoides avenae]|nr:hypothetical protein AAVH_09768 [Aphelenchus avenae]